MGTKFRFTYWTTKRKQTAAGNAFAPAAVMFNDGCHLYARGPSGVLKHLPFSVVCRDVPCSLVSGFAFPEADILFKSFGHTLNKSAIILLRSPTENWSLNLSIGPGVTATVFDFGDRIHAVLEK